MIRRITSSFISDGQDYRSLLLDDEVAEFSMVLYGGSIYRFADERQNDSLSEAELMEYCESFLKDIELVIVDQILYNR